ncbi:MAG: primosomal protein N' [Chloroflexota bacterium]
MTFRETAHYYNERVCYNNSMYVEIAVNAPVNQTFHYHIPDALEGKLAPGHLVQVPFGTAIQYGIILALDDDSPIQQTKPVTALLDPHPVVTPVQIEVARWISERYLAPIGLCLWLMLPPGLTGGRDIRVALLQEDAKSTDPVEQKILALLARRGALTGHQFESAKALQGIQWRGAVDQLAKEGVVSKERILMPPRVRPKTVATAALAIHPDQIPLVARHLGKESNTANILEVMAAMRVEQPTVEQVLEAADVKTKAPLEKLEEAGLVVINRSVAPHRVALNIPRFKVDEKLVELRKGDKHLHILKVLAREAGPMEVNWLYAQTGTKLDDLKHLEEDGLILLGEQHTWRDSLADRDFVPAVAPPLTPEQDAAWAVIHEAIKKWDWEIPPADLLPVYGEGEKDNMGVEEKSWRIPSPLWDKLKPLARQMRHAPTPAEDMLWQQLRRKQLGFTIRRQHAIGRFITDFYCAEAKLIIEVDGEIHDYTQEEDALRQEILESLGYKVIRFKNESVFSSLDIVLKSIRENLISQKDFASAPPLRTRGGGWGEGFLLHGVTGSGKTEIYLRAIEQTLAQGRQAIFLVPEIALTAQTVRRVAARFPGQVAIVHSGLSDGERYDTWRRAREGLIGVVVGARSALFTPLPDVGLVILDEEHDNSYKQSPPIPPPYYHARDVAEAMMRQNNGVLILGSATPDLETVYRAQQGDLTLLRMPSRIMGHRVRIMEQSERTGVAARYYPARAEDAVTIDLPPVKIVDMREELKAGNVSIFSRDLQTALTDTLNRKQQAILFLNRRGSSTYVFCRDCGYVAACPRCDTPLTYHRNAESLRCHQCGYQVPQPRVCPQCGSNRIKFFGAGTQQIEQMLIHEFPGVRTLRWDADTATNPETHDLFLSRFVERKADVLIGTQMVTKGLDLPMVTLVGVVSADLALNLPDFRAGETTFQLLTQVAGRAGRGLLGGRVVLQTYQPDHYAIKAAAKHDFDGFYAQEIGYRRDLGYPPFRRLVRIIFQSESDTRAQADAEEAANFLRKRLEQLDMTGTELIGPAPCFFSRVNQVYRWHLILRGPDPTVALRGLEIGRGWHVDIDPVDVL